MFSSDIAHPVSPDGVPLSMQAPLLVQSDTEPLLRQPGGFEGFGLGGKALQMNALAVAPSRGLSQGNFERHPALSSLNLSSAGGDDPIPAVHNLLQVDLDRLECLVLIRPPSSNPVVTFDPTLDASQPRNPFHCWIQHGDYPVEVVTVDGVDALPVKLHVLLRHRPRSISGRHPTATLSCAEPDRPPP